MQSVGYAEPVSEEARRHLDRGQMAVEMAKTDGDLSDAIKEFQKAAELAPNWPEPYYSLGMAQNKMERFGDALKNLTRYLQLTPNASNAKEVKQLINKIEYKKEREVAVVKAFELMASDRVDWKKISAVDKGPDKSNGLIAYFNIPEGFRMNKGALEKRNGCYKMWHDKWRGWVEWVPVRINGSFFEYTYTYVVNGIYGNKKGYHLQEVKGEGEIISLDPVRTKTVVIDKTLGLLTNTNEFYRFEEKNTTEYVMELRPK
jgi:tetratricopeptide (TPR) repeat protein